MKEDITIVPVRNLTYDEAEAEINNYIKQNGGKKVYVSEIAEHLVIDLDLIETVLKRNGMKRQ